MNPFDTNTRKPKNDNPIWYDPTLNDAFSEFTKQILKWLHIEDFIKENGLCQLDIREHFHLYVMRNYEYPIESLQDSLGWNILDKNDETKQDAVSATKNTSDEKKDKMDNKKGVNDWTLEDVQMRWKRKSEFYSSGDK